MLLALRFSHGTLLRFELPAKSTCGAKETGRHHGVRVPGSGNGLVEGRDVTGW